MKTTYILIGSASFFAALTVAMPVSTSAKTVQLVVKTGDGDSAAGVTVTLDQVFSTLGQTQASAGVSVSLDDPNAICQAFSDNAATVPLGAPFTSAAPVSFSPTSDGGVDSNIKDAVPIGAFLCSNSANGLKKGTPGSSTSRATARLQLEIESDTFQNDVRPMAPSS